MTDSPHQRAHITHNNPSYLFPQLPRQPHWAPPPTTPAQTQLGGIMVLLLIFYGVRGATAESDIGRKGSGGAGDLKTPMFRRLARERAGSTRPGSGGGRESLASISCHWQWKWSWLQGEDGEGRGCRWGGSQGGASVRGGEGGGRGDPLDDTQ